MKKYIRASWMAVYNLFDDIATKYMATPDRINDEVARMYRIHKGDPDYDEAYRRWCEDADIDADVPPALFVIKDNHGRQLSSPNPDSDELWDRVASMEARGRRGLCVVAYVPNRQVNSAFNVDDTDFDSSDQEFSSADTSLNQVAGVFRKVNWSPNTMNLDYGGGKFDRATEYLKDYGVTNLVYDKYNRSAEHNNQVIQKCRDNGGADSATCANVLNVIKEQYERLNVLRNIKRLVKAGGPVYITVYEGTGRAEGPTSKGYQMAKKTQWYLDEVMSVFPDAKYRNGMIVAHA